MSNFNVSDTGGFRTVRFDRGTANAINGDFLSELREIYRDSLRDDGIAGLMMAGKEHFFSAGLDIIELYQYDEPEFEAFWDLFMHTVYDLAAFDKPVAAAVSGHAPAGGCILAMTADHRVMLEGKYRIGLNEVPVGIIVPPSIFHLYSFCIGRQQAARFLQEGRLLSVEEAVHSGLVDDTAAGMADLERKCMHYLERQAEFHQGAWRHTKKNIRKDLLRQLEVHKDIHFEQSLEQWWKPEVREMMQGFIDRLKIKN